MEHAHPGVDLHRGAQQKILDRGVEILAHHQARLGCEQGDVGRREILGEIADAPRQRRLTQERIERDIGVRAGHIEKLLDSPRLSAG